MRQLVLFLVLLMLAGCSSSTQQYPMCTNIDGGKQGVEGELLLERIIVLPTAFDHSLKELAPDRASRLAEGCQVLTRLMTEYLSCRNNVMVLSPLQEESFAGTFMGHGLDRARYIGMQAGGDAILISHLNRFRKLQGSEYGAKEMASVAFDFQLIHLKSGATLCKGSYDETQKPLLSDIFSLPKARQRNFKFVTAAALLKEGIEARFSDCSHLAR